MWPLLTKAREELARLDGVGQHLPNSQILLRPLQNREAQKSSSLEGTIATPEQLVLFEINPTDSELDVNELEAVREVNNYARASRYHSENARDIPLSLRLIRTIHKILLEGVRGSEKTPG